MWRRGGGHAGEREEEDGLRRGLTADGGARRRSGARREGRKGDHRRGGKEAWIPFLGSDAAGAGRRRRIAAAHAGGEKKGKSRREGMGSIRGVGSISGTKGTRHGGRMEQSSAVEVRRREAASGSGCRRRRAHSEQRRRLGGD
ncbi:Epstein-Barr virus EBNA-1-like protein [Oryza sativa Japonica Group]|uniref:Epstein-Barr virus EBNA-1-like protein n=1 Tax=Oryza sativa subsp. japonica TaxID=39947 RepID=Q5N7I9_ORYSJ|nr:Epstein-Barr virus EBNA-1-like protein [Oryza sativa Japonica Group]